MPNSLEMARHRHRSLRGDLTSDQIPTDGEPSSDRPRKWAAKVRLWRLLCAFLLGS